MSVFCYRCERWFPHDNALSQHKRDSLNHYCCNSCDKDFDSWAKLVNHYIQKHHYCKSCNTLFDDSDDLLDHWEVEHFACRTCVKMFTSSDALANHNESSHYYCRECNRSFNSASALSNHRASSIHALRSISCPGLSCRKSFASVSALLHHAESGACPSGVTRKVVNSLAARIDRHNIITNPARMITSAAGVRSAPPEPELWATEWSWNGAYYGCFLCSDEFQTLDSLNQHLKSPRHLQSIYHCPMKGCDMEFTVLSALCQHVEMSACGIKLINTMKNLAKGIRALGF